MATQAGSSIRVVGADPFDPDHDAAYRAWRAQKLVHYPTTMDELIVPLREPLRLSEAERQAILARCRKTNMAIYACNPSVGPDKSIPRAIAASLGLFRLDGNLYADDDGITALTVVPTGHRHDFIPYTEKAIHWHTDGYYNAPAQQVYGLVLHCVNDAMEGGENALLDHEIAYILLRDESPAHIRALMRPDAMTIPPHVEGGRVIRPASTGPVFSVHPRSGRLHMRYTQRARNVEWRSDDETQAAVAALKRILDGDSPYIFRATLRPGQGLICNNVLHNRSAFVDYQYHRRRRLLYRARYYDRIAGT